MSPTPTAPPTCPFPLGNRNELEKEIDPGIRSSSCNTQLPPYNGATALRSLRGVKRPYLGGWKPRALVPKVLVHLRLEFRAPALWSRRRLANPNPVRSGSRLPHPLGPTPCQESRQAPSWELTSPPVPGTSPSHCLLSPPSLQELAKESSQGGGVGSALAPADWACGQSLRGVN